MQEAGSESVGGFALPRGGDSARTTAADDGRSGAIPADLAGASGSLYLSADSSRDLRIERRIIGRCSLVRLRLRGAGRFQRGWNQIRDDGVDVVLFCLRRRGALRIGPLAGRHRCDDAQAVVVHSTRPFALDMEPVSGISELLVLAVPAHHLRVLLADAFREDHHVLGNGSRVRITDHLLSELLAQDAELSAELAARLVETAISVMAEAIAEATPAPEAPRSMGAQRLAAILHYIDTHLSDPALSTASVARACGISQRYLSVILQRNRTPFSQLVWDRRLRVAVQWLRSSRASEVPVSEVAYRTGFKSPAHFSRMFRRVYQRSPSQCRSLGGVSDAAVGSRV